MQEQPSPVVAPDALDAILAFLERTSMAKDITDVNIAAGIALQALGVLPLDATA